ncbi:hypothetical protein [Methylobacterium sp. D54C]
MLDAPADQVLTLIAVGIIMVVSGGMLIVRDLPAFRRLTGEA